MTSVKLHLYTHKTLKDRSHPILFQILKDRKRKTISTGYSATVSQWNKSKNLPNKNHPNSRLLTNVLKKKVVDVETEVLRLEEKGKPYTLDDLVKRVKGIKSDYTFKTYAEEKIKELKDTGKTGNSCVYKYTLNAWQKYRKNKDIKLEEITYKEIKGFENYLFEIDNKPNSVSLHLRTARAIINKAIKEGLKE